MQYFTTDNDLAKIYFESKLPKKKVIKESSYCPYWKIYRVTRDAEPEVTLIPGTEEHGFTEQTAMAEIAKRNKAPNQDGTSWWSCSPDPEFDHNKWNREMLGESEEPKMNGNPDAPKGELVYREQKREVEIGEELLRWVDKLYNRSCNNAVIEDAIENLANELIEMHLHTTKLKDKPLSGWDTLQLKNK